MADFSVTSCTVSRSIVAPEDTIDITMTIKNTSGMKIVQVHTLSDAVNWLMDRK